MFGTRTWAKEFMSVVAEAQITRRGLRVRLSLRVQKTTTARLLGSEKF